MVLNGAGNRDCFNTLNVSSDLFPPIPGAFPKLRVFPAGSVIFSTARSRTPSFLEPRVPYFCTSDDMTPFHVFVSAASAKATRQRRTLMFLHVAAIRTWIQTSLCMLPRSAMSNTEFMHVAATLGADCSGNTCIMIAEVCSQANAKSLRFPPGLRVRSPCL